MSRPWRSLAPGRQVSRSPAEVVELLNSPPVLREALAVALQEIGNAAAAAFPDNIFFDLERIAASLLRAGTQEGAAGLQTLGRRIAGLQGLYGQATAIRFRYVHDFVYGYDWAKWIRREPHTRAGVGPFEAPFIEHMERRADELGRLIEADDRTYPRLPEGQVRNPFPFSREPAAEAALLLDLAGHRLLPVEAWDPAAESRWDRPYAELRVERAAALGLLVEATS